MAEGGQATTRNGRQATAPRRSMLITIPRSCSNLLVKILACNRQEHVKHTEYHFLDALLHAAAERLSSTPPEEWTDEQKLGMHKVVAEGIAKLEEDIQFEDHHIVGFTKEHCNTIVEPTVMSRYVNSGKADSPREDYSVKASPLRWTIPGYESLYTELNETVFPDAYLLCWKPIFLIRHPIRVFESYLRGMANVFAETSETFTKGITTTETRNAINKCAMTYQFHRTLYNFYLSRGIRPIVVDADDLLLHTQPVTHKLAEYIGLDLEKLQYEWEPTKSDDLEKRPAHMRSMLSSLDASTGISKDKLGASVGTVEEEMVGWREKFGDEGAALLRERVGMSWGDYESLWKRRMVV